MTIQQDRLSFLVLQAAGGTSLLQWRCCGTKLLATMQALGCLAHKCSCCSTAVAGWRCVAQCPNSCVGSQGDLHLVAPLQSRSTVPDALRPEPVFLLCDSHRWEHWLAMVFATMVIGCPWSLHRLLICIC